MPVLHLRPLSKSLRVYQSPAVTYLGPADLFGVAGSQRVIRVELVEFTRLKQIKSWIMWRKVKWLLLTLWEDGPCPKATQLSFSLCLWHPLSPIRIFQEFLKKNCTTGPGWLTLPDPPALYELGRAGSQVLIRVEPA